MDPKVLLNIAVEELGAVPDGQSYVVEQFQAHSSVETKHGAKALFSASELGSPTGSPSRQRKSIRRRVALVERAHLSDEQQKSILKELSFMWTLRHHPHVVDYSNCFLTPNFLAVTGEGANMGTLRSFLKRFTRANKRTLAHQQHGAVGTAPGVPASAARFLFQQLVMVVDYCHRINESISGALTPDNVVICWNGSAPQVKIAATGKSGILTPAACPELPSFAFQAPEASSAHVKAASSEVFSLGALLFFALTGTPPFPVLEGETREKWIERVVHSEVDIPAYVSDIGGLHNLLRRMLGPAQLRCTLSDIMEHSFFLTDLPEGALKLSDKVASAGAGSEAEKLRVYSSLQQLLSCCTAQPQHTYDTMQHPPHSAQPAQPAQPSVPAQAYPNAPANLAPLHVGVNSSVSSAVKQSSPVATASGYTAVASKDLNLQLGPHFSGGCNSFLNHDVGASGRIDPKTCGGGQRVRSMDTSRDVLDTNHCANPMNEQRNQELAQVYSAEDVRVSIVV